MPKKQTNKQKTLSTLSEPPPPRPPLGLIHFFEINNIHIREFFYPHARTPSPLSLIYIQGPPPLIHKMCLICCFFGTLPLIYWRDWSNRIDQIDKIYWIDWQFLSILNIPNILNWLNILKRVIRRNRPNILDKPKITKYTD